MIDVVLCFQAHQPHRLRQLVPGERVDGLDYFDVALDREVLERVAASSYLPMSRLLLDLITAHEGRFRCAFALSGTLIEQLRAWAPRVLDSFVALAETGHVEFLCGTSHQSLAAVADLDEFAAQVEIQRAIVAELFGAPVTFCNTDLILDNHVCAKVEELGFSCMLGEGAQALLDWRTPHVPYRPRTCRQLRVLLRNGSLSDDIAFRFSDRRWDRWPLFADTYARWLHEVPPPAQFIGLYMDYATFGEHQARQTGILEFMRHLPGQVLRDSRFRFGTPATVAAQPAMVAELDVRETVSSAGVERVPGCRIGNPMQDAALEALYGLLPRIAAVADARPELLAAWRRLSTADHIHYAATGQDGEAAVHGCFSPFESPHAAFVALMTAIDDLRLQVDEVPRKCRN